MGGFEKATDTTVTPSAEPVVITRSMGTPTDVAQPGEIWFGTQASLTAQENTDLDNLLVSHDETQKSTAQVEKETDETELDQLLSEHNNFGTLTNDQKIAAIKRLMRAILRSRGRI
jgi:hypothetical protein